MAVQTTNVRKFFEFKTLSPSSLKVGNLISFSYRSPNGVHDRYPLVYVSKKERDRFYGFNVHYDGNQLTEILQNITDKIDEQLAEEYFDKYPQKATEYKKKHLLFTKKDLTRQDLKEFTRRIYKPELESYELDNSNVETLRNYLFKRMNMAKKLIYKV
jgi:hypothetical protein